MKNHSLSPPSKNNSLRRNAGAVCVTVHTPLFREVFWHVYAKIPRHTARIYALRHKFWASQSVLLGTK